MAPVPPYSRPPPPPRAALQEAAEADDDESFKKSAQFSTHLKKSEAASDFSRNKTIAEQRRFLPVYSVRDELLNVRTTAQGAVDSLPACMWLMLLSCKPGCCRQAL